MKIDALFDYTEIAGDCWIWTKARTSKGYGLARKLYGRLRRAHRVAWELRLRRDS